MLAHSAAQNRNSPIGKIMSDLTRNRLTGNIILIFICVCFIVSTLNHESIAAAIYGLAIAVFYGLRELCSHLKVIARKMPESPDDQL